LAFADMRLTLLRSRTGHPFLWCRSHPALPPKLPRQLLTNSQGSDDDVETEDFDDDAYVTV